MIWHRYHFPPLREGLDMDDNPLDGVTDDFGLFHGNTFDQAASLSFDMTFQQLRDDELKKGFDEGFAKGFAESKVQGFQAGLVEGQAQGLQSAQAAAYARFQGLEQPLASAITQMQQYLADQQQLMHETVVELVGKVARQVIRCELSLNAKQILNLVDETLNNMGIATDAPKLNIELNPADFNRLRDVAPERMAAWPFKANDKLAVGECKIHTHDTEIDAGCEHRLEACMTQVDQQVAQMVAEKEVNPQEVEHVD